ncbi:unnamed protein product [Urochloa decumbens]|uniref:Dirigent protein n=1 Tax=Urochloa decumbens TaxID=240449 RepID=A0ABC9D703_9POAL
MANPQAAPLQHASFRQEELYLALYAQQVSDGDGKNESQLIDPGLTKCFGLMMAYDWPVYDGQDTSSLKPVARAQGQHIQPDMIEAGQCFHTGNIVFEKTSRHPGSTIVFIGNGRGTEGEWAIVGGTGDFTFAQGVIYYKTVNIYKKYGNEGKDGSLKRLDIRVLYRPVQKSELKYVFGEFSPSEVEHGTKGKKPIGEGAFGCVYRANIRDTIVAVKILKRENLKAEKDLKSEIEIFKRIRHENLVTLMGACIEKRALIYEFCNNGTLGDCLFSPATNSSSGSATASTTTIRRWKPLSWKDRVRIAGSICSGLKFLHAVPIAHSDLKPNNILFLKDSNNIPFDAQGVCKICDFGLARLLKPTSDTGTPAHFTFSRGTPYYCDPVVTLNSKGERKLTRKSDVYSLGIIMLQLVTGKGANGLKDLVSEVVRREAGNNTDENTCRQLVDPAIWKDLDATSKEDALKMVRLALECSSVTNEGRDRPDAATVCLKIESMAK